jgi:hypothetical protein
MGDFGLAQCVDYIYPFLITWGEHSYRLPRFLRVILQPALDRADDGRDFSIWCVSLGNEINLRGRIGWVWLGVARRCQFDVRK